MGDNKEKAKVYYERNKEKLEEYGQNRYKDFSGEEKEVNMDAADF